MFIYMFIYIFIYNIFTCLGGLPWESPVYNVHLHSWKCLGKLRLCQPPLEGESDD